MIQTKQMKILVVNHQDDCNAERFQSWLEQAGFQIDNRLGPAGELSINKSWHYFDEDGYMVRNQAVTHNAKASLAITDPDNTVDHDEKTIPLGTTRMVSVSMATRTLGVLTSTLMVRECR